MFKRPIDKEFAFPNAKINLGLFVTRRRSDGYHILQTLFYPIDWCDALEIVVGTKEPGNVKIRPSGMMFDGDPENNLCVKAYRALQKLFPDLPGCVIHLEKRIPFGAGLGGGSSDAAWTLMMLDKMFQLGLTQEELERCAASLGADCAFFCREGAQYCEGVGNELEPYDLSLRGKWMVVVKPPFGVSTKEAYADVRPQKPEVPLYDLLKRPIEDWKDCIRNDFEASVFPKHPELREAKACFYANGAIYASMSGSGSAMFGIFDHEVNPTGWFPPDWIVQAMPSL